MRLEPGGRCFERTGGPAEDPFDRKAGQDWDAAKGQAAGTHTCATQEE